MRRVLPESGLDAAYGSASLAGALVRDGYAIVRGLVPVALVAAIDAELAADFEATPFCVGDFYGRRTKRFGRLLARSASIPALVEHSVILAATEDMLRPWTDTLQLNLAQAIAVHPGAPRQFPHRDQDMWRGVTGEVEYLVNVIWPLTRFTAMNGATLIWPGSHGRAALSGAPSDAEPMTAEAEPGDAIVFLGSTLHGAGENISAECRRGIIVSYCLGWLKPYENQWLAYPPDVARHFSSGLAGLVGYRQHRPNLGNYEGQCPSILLAEQLPDRVAATDALRPDQATQLAAWVAASAGRSAPP